MARPRIIPSDWSILMSDFGLDLYIYKAKRAEALVSSIIDHVSVLIC
jgi:hypothetical protein